MAEDETTAAFGLTQSQLLMWAGQRLHPESALYNQAFTFAIRGALDAPRLGRALATLIEETDALRLVIEIADGGEPRQRIAPADAFADFRLEVVDLDSDGDAAGRADELVAARSQRIFDLGTRLFDALLLRLGEEHWQLFFCQHHVATDAWSVANLFRRLDEIYRGLDTAPLPPWRSYAKRLLKKKTPPSSEQHWLSFSEDPEQSVPKLYGRELPSLTHSERVEIQLDGQRSDALKALASRPEVGALTAELGLFNVLATLLFAFQYRVSGQSALTLGAPAHNRTSARDRDLPGLLTEVFPLRLEIQEGETFKSLLAKTRAASFDFLRHAAPGASRARASRSFAVVLNFIHGTFGDFAGAAAETRWLHPGHHDREHPLRVHVHDFSARGRLTLLFDLNPQTVDRRAVGHVERLLEAMLEDLDRPIDTVTLVAGEERAQLLAAACGEPTRAKTPHSVIEAFSAQVAKTPETIALRSGELEITYRQLDAYARGLAGQIRARRLGSLTEPDGLAARRVAYEAERCAEAVISILGILYAGATYVPIDPAWPARRVRWLLEDAGIVAMVRAARGHSENGVSEDSNTVDFGVVPVIEVDLDASLDDAAGWVTSDTEALERNSHWPDGENRRKEAGGGKPRPYSGRGELSSPKSDAAASSEPEARPNIDPDSPAYVLYTSGSTGQPKGVVISHRALANYVDWAATFYRGAAPDGAKALSMPLFSPLTFDLTVTSLFVPLVTGGQIVVYPETSRQADLALLHVVREDAVDVVKLTPSHLQLLTPAESDRKPGSDRRRIRQLIFGGEALTREMALRARQIFGPDVVIHNEYGPTEATVGCVVHSFDPERDRSRAVPIGDPITGLRAYVLDRHLEPVPEGVIGELVLGGVGLAEGYLARPGLQAERFVDNPFEAGERLYRTGDRARFSAGRLEYLGRQDDQVKIRGARVELGEIEAALAEHPDLASGAVVLERPGLEKTTLPGTGMMSAGDVLEGYSTVKGPDSASQVEDLTSKRFCQRCGLSSEHPNAVIDDSGICSECLAFESYREKVAGYFRGESDLRQILAAPREKSPGTGDPEPTYDCLALLSGGKDSTYVLGRLVDMGFRVFAFTLDNGYISEQAKGNIRRVVETLGVDHIFGQTPAMKSIFADSLARFSNVCQGCFKTIYTLAVQEAESRRIPFIVTGLSRGQLFETRLTRELFTDLDFDPEGIDHMVLEARKAYHRSDDAVSRHLDVSLFQDDALFERVRFIDFFRFCDVELAEMYAYLDERLPWVRPSDTGRSTNCLINDVGIHVHKKERGFHNYAHPYAWDVRMGHKTRDAALDELDDEIDLERVEKILAEIGYTPRHGGGERLVAYFTVSGSSETPDAASLRTFLQERLPDFMLPGAYVALGEMPLTAHGKIDRAALAKRRASASGEGNVAGGSSATEKPRGRAEKALAELFAQVLRVPQVSVTANFFELGGDSILAIQLVARAQSRGVRFSPEQLFEALTVRRLAKLCTLDDPAEQLVDQIGATENAGAVPLLPAQAFFFAETKQDGAHLQAWHQVLEIEISPEADSPSPDALREAWGALPAHHGALRERFAEEDGRWTAHIEGSPATPELRVIDFEDPDTDHRAGVEKELIDEIQGRFRRGEAPLLAGAVLRRPDAPDRLILVAHHLVVDAVSWSILLRDLEDLTRGEKIPPPRSSLGAWAATSVPRDALTFWRRQLEAGGGRLPRETVRAGIGEIQHLSRRLDLESTRQWLEEIPKTGDVRVHEVLIGAFASTLARWRNEKSIAFFLEGHGRDNPTSDQQGFDASRLVGWLTSLYPIALELGKDGFPERLETVRRQLRAIPAGGVEYGRLRYGDSGSEDAERLASLENHDVLFNYLGQAEQLLGGSSCFELSRPLRLVRDLQPFFLEVNAAVSEGQLEVEWSFHADIFRAETIEAQAEHFLHEMRSWIAETLRVGTAAGGDKPQKATRDFPLAKLDDTKMAKLGALLGKRRG